MLLIIQKTVEYQAKLNRTWMCRDAESFTERGLQSIKQQDDKTEVLFIGHQAINENNASKSR
jgi:hypothetical protein